MSKVFDVGVTGVVGNVDKFSEVCKLGTYPVLVLVVVTRVDGDDGLKSELNMDSFEEAPLTAADLLCETRLVGVLVLLDLNVNVDEIDEFLLLWL